MEVTYIRHTDGHNEVRYGRDPVEIRNGIEWCTWSQITTEQMDRIQKATTEQVQEVITHIFTYGIQ